MSYAVYVERFGGPEVLRWRSQPDPSPAPLAGQVHLEISHTSVNYADVLARQGRGDKAGTLPFIPGLDALGSVTALDENVQNLTLGQRVACFPLGGSYAEALVAPAHLCFPVPAGVPDAAAASLTTLVTAYNVVHHAGRVQPGETVLVHAAAGGVGHLAVQLARLAGAARIVGVVSGPQRADFVRGLGADEVVDRRQADFAERVRAVTDGRGADVILDSVGGETAERGLGVLAPFGRLVLYGHASGEEARLPSKPLHRQSKSVIGYSSGHHRQGRPEVVQQAAARAFDLVAAGQLRVQVGAEFALADAAQAHALVEGGDVLGRVLLRA
ncbi:quinone oxidoreductase family protein [Deinococcus wulumuqiensis]|uniref:Quinone oxidoreductase n=1 Tax=Deinococcus wulumuqiensis TaxID=980427 RepID=A0AAV4KAW6_9DEIO|nr:NADPH:quinone oxidoreductase family protein [Deinococcus wulumuqiensis]QII20928.1 NADPH:quinone oxidoreductase family protein [Deinococcus wulumuqiensis R12]GGI93272.1 quinone oxidoreductase [Deinococcus wulumuqiensis]GGP31245.1 quinone oxidoreductase [Deinococcus wulumuqiensis]